MADAPKPRSSGKKPDIRINISESKIENMTFNDGTKPSSVGSKDSQSDGKAKALSENFFYSTSGVPPRILIISNSGFKENPLAGYKEDAKKLYDWWSATGAKVFPYHDCSLEEMKNHLKNFREDVRKEERFCAVFILSHGGKEECGEVVYDITEDQYISIENIIQMFDNTHTNLQNLPKLFFFQCCRGIRRRKGVVKAGGGALPAGPIDDKLPYVSDTLAMYATQSNEVAIVDGNGSWLVKELLGTLSEWAEDLHLADLLTIVNDKVSRNVVTDSDEAGLVGVKCMSEIRSTLRKRLKIKEPYNSSL